MMHSPKLLFSLTMRSLSQLMRRMLTWSQTSSSSLENVSSSSPTNIIISTTLHLEAFYINLCSHLKIYFCICLPYFGTELWLIYVFLYCSSKKFRENPKRFVINLLQNTGVNPWIESYFINIWNLNIFVFPMDYE